MIKSRIEGCTFVGRGDLTPLFYFAERLDGACYVNLIDMTIAPSERVVILPENRTFLQRLLVWLLKEVSDRKTQWS